MQSINAAAPTALFMTALFGTALTGLALGAPALLRTGEPGALLRVVGCALYLVAVVLTIVYHVPHNNALAALDPSSAGAADQWRHYPSGWTAWNHVRAASALGAAVAFTLALRAGRLPA